MLQKVEYMSGLNHFDSAFSVVKILTIKKYENLDESFLRILFGILHDGHSVMNYSI